MQIFERQGKNLSAITPIGRQIIKIAERMLNDVQNIKNVAADQSSANTGELSIATTHTQARHALPPAVHKLTSNFPSVALHMHQGTPMQIAEMASNGEVDFCVATEAMELFENLIMLPCYRWNRCVIVPPEHPLANAELLSIEQLAQYPLVTYVFGFTGRSKLDKAFQAAGLDPNVVFTATDSEVIKTYVKLGLGVGIVADMAYDREVDTGLVAIPVDHLFDPSTTYIGFRKGMLLRRYMYDFIEWFAPHLTHSEVDKIISLGHKEDRAEYISTLLRSLELK